MSSTIDIESLLLPVPGDNPAGEPLPLAIRTKLNSARKEVDPSAFAEDHPRRPSHFQPADWSGILETTKETLAKTGKDLEVVVRLTEALLKLNGFAGLLDGLRLARRLSEIYWEQLHPILEEGRADARAGVLDWLDEETRGALFPNSVRSAPLTNVRGEQKFGWQYWKDSQDNMQKYAAPSTSTKVKTAGLEAAKTAKSTFDRAVSETPREFCQTVVDEIGQCLAELDLFTTFLGEKMAEAAPGFARLRVALLDCEGLAQENLKRKGPATAPAPPAAGNGVPSVNNTAAAATAAIQPLPVNRPATREELLQRLAEASEALFQLEPHSPIAYLFQRAVKLARLPLPDLMRILVRDVGVLGQLDRELDLGLEVPPAKPSK